MFDELDSLFKNQEFNDCKLRLRNLDYESLLNKAAGQELFIIDLEEAISSNLRENIELLEKLDAIESQKNSLIIKNEKLEQSLLVNCYK